MPLAILLKCSFDFALFFFIWQMNERQHLRIYRKTHRASGKGSGILFSTRLSRGAMQYLHEMQPLFSRSLSLACHRKCVKRRFCWSVRPQRNEPTARCGLKRGNAILTSFLTPLCLVWQELCVLSCGFS